MNFEAKGPRGAGYFAMATVAAVGVAMAAVGPMVLLQAAAPVLVAQVAAPKAQPGSSPAPVPKPQPAPKQAAPPKAAPAGTDLPDLQEALKSLDREMAVVQQALQGEMQRIDAAMLEIEPSLEALGESLRNLKLDLSIHTMGTLTRQQYQEAEAALLEGTRQRLELEKQEMIRDPEGYRRRGAEYLEPMAREFRISPAAVEAGLRVLEQGGRRSDALAAMIEADRAIRGQR
jgi:hypothetical protein